MTTFGPLIRKTSQLSGTHMEHSNPVRKFKAGRTCEIEGCDARLSVYNPGPVCALHQLGYQPGEEHPGRRKIFCNVASREVIVGSVVAGEDIFDLKTFAGDGTRLRA